MLNRDCKVSSAKKRKKPTTTKKTSSKAKKPSKKGKVYYIMLLLWIVPFSVSGYLLYLQYQQYVKNRRADIRRRQNRSSRPVLSRSQIRRLRRRFLNNEDNNQSANNRRAKIFLIKVNRTIGRVYLKSIRANLSGQTNNPKEAIRKLIAFRLSNRMKRKNYFSCIPRRTKLISSNLRNGTLILNFNRNFTNNSNGTEQIKMKAAQIVYTATQYPGIRRVKFTVNGRSLRDWGGEGVFLSSVLSRADVPRTIRLN